MLKRCRFTHIKTRWFMALTPYKSSEGMFALIFPLFLFNNLHASARTVGVLSALVSLGAVLGAMYWGFLSDRYHTRRAFIVLGCALSGVWLASIGCTTQVLVLALLAVAFGFCSIAPAPIASILIMETLPQREWDNAFGRFNMFGGWGGISGLLTGLWVLPLLERVSSPALSMRLAMWGLAVLMLATAWWAARTIPQPKYRVRRQQFVTVTQRLPRLAMMERALYLPRRLLFVLHPDHLRQLRSWASPLLLRYLLATALMFVSFITALVPFPLFLQETHGMGTTPIFALVLVRALAAVPFYTWSGQWILRLGAYRVQIWALLGRCVAFGVLGCLWLVEPYPLTVILLVSINLLIGITWSGIAVAGPSVVSLLTMTSHCGKAMGFYNAVQGVAQIFGAIVGGFLVYWVGYSSTFLVAGFCLLPAIALLVSLECQDAHGHQDSHDHMQAQHANASAT